MNQASSSSFLSANLATRMDASTSFARLECLFIPPRNAFVACFLQANGFTRSRRSPSLGADEDEEFDATSSRSELSAEEMEVEVEEADDEEEEEEWVSVRGCHEGELEA